MLSLLEKDIANSLQEWNDILPGVINIEVAYVLLEEKEADLNNAIKEKEDLNKRFIEEKELQTGEEGKLRLALIEKEKQISELNQQVSQLKTRAANSTVIGGYSGYSGRMLTAVLAASGAVIPLGPESEAGAMGMAAFCKKCGKSYTQKALGDRGLCNDCEGKKSMG